MPGYWNRPASGQKEVKEPTRDRGGPQGGAQERQQNLQAIQEANKQAQLRFKKQQEIDEKRDYGSYVYGPERVSTGTEDYDAKMARAQESQKLGSALTASGITKAQFDRMKAKGTLPPEVAAQMGLAEKKGGLWYDTKTGKRYVPKEHGFSEDQYLGLGEQQFAMDEGVYGGVAGIEAEVNKAKKRFAETGDRTHLEGLGYDPGVIDQMDPWTKDESGEWVENPAYNPSLGYDPTGVYTFSDIEDTARFGKDDPRNLYQSKYLNRGTLYDDPLSGILSPPKQKYYGGPGGGGWGGYGGGGGGGGYGGYGGYGPRPGMSPEQKAGYYTPQANLQQAMVNVHQTPTGFQPGYKRGGIVSLLGLRS